MRRTKLPFLIVGVLILGLFVFMALFPQVFTSYGRKDSFGPWMPSSYEHMLGTSSLGYDIFTELVYGTRETLVIGITSSVLSLVLGFIIGVLSTSKGFIGTIFDGIINIFVLLPKLIVLIVLASFLGGSMINLIVLISLFTWSGTARAVRARVIHLKSETFIESGVLYGYSKFHMAIYHILPNLKDVLISKFLINITACIMLESTLSFIGFGDVYYPTWGVMVNLARTRGAMTLGVYQYLLAPSICIMLLSLSFYFISTYFEKKKETINDD